METLELFQRLSVALAIGLMIGLERGWQARDEAEGERAAGFRTHALAGLLGGVWGALAHSSSDGGTIALGLAFVTFSSAVIIFRFRETAYDKTFGMTTVVAAMLAFALGAFAVLGNMQVAAAAGVAVVALLALKPALHAWLNRLSWLELRSGLVLLAMTLILLPLLPNRTVDKWSAINPYEIWLMTVMIAVFSFAGYLAIKTLGDQRGILFSGIAGGLASSTAVTVTMARFANLHPNQAPQLSGGAIIAGAIMMVRVLAVTSVANAALLTKLVLPLGFAATTLAFIGMYYVRNGSQGSDNGRSLTLSNPFELGTVLQFGALLTVVGVLGKYLTQVGGDKGAYALAAVSGIADVDAITLSMSRLAGNEISADTAAAAIAIAAGVNTISKAALGWMIGGSAIGSRLMIAALLAVAAAFAGHLLNMAT